MKQLITAFAIAAMLPMSLAAAGPYDITWYKGKTFSSAAAISNNTAESFGRVYGIFPEGTTIEVPENTTVSITGPADSHLKKTTTLSANPSKSQQDPNSENPGDIIQVVYPGVYFWISNSEWYSVETPGVYTVSFPAGTFKVNGAANEAFDVDFIVEDNTTFTPVDMTVAATPIEGTSADKFSEFKLKVTNDEGGKQKWQSQGVKYGSKITVIDLATNDEYKCDIIQEASFTYSITYSAKCDPAITRSGNYKVVWPAGFMKLLNKSNSANETNKEFSYIYTCTGDGDNTGGGDDKPVVTDGIVWSQGNEWATRTAIVNNTVNSLGTLWGVMEGQNVKVPYCDNPAAKKAVVKGPAEGYTDGKEVKIDWVRQDDGNGNLVELPAFRVFCADYPKRIEYPGDYTVTIPEGAFTVDGAPNAEIVYNVKVEDTRDYQPVDLPIDHVVPTPDGATSTTQGTLSNISVYISNKSVNGVRPYQSMGVSPTLKPVITLPDGTTASFELKDLGTYTDMLRFFVKGDYGYTKAGRYTLTIPQGTIRLASGTSSAYYTNKELTYTWTLSGQAEVDHKIMLTPASHDVQALAGIEVSSPDDLFLRVNDPSGITVTTPSGEAKVLKSIVSPNEFYINCFRENEIFTEKGTYKFNIAEGAISFVDSEGNVSVSTRSYSYDYNVAGGEVGELSYKITDADGNEVVGSATTYSMNAYYVQFDKAVTPTTYPYYTLVYPDGTKQYIKATWGGNPGRFQLFPSYPKQMGEYKFIFPAGAALADGVFNSTIEFTVNQIDQTKVDLAVTSDPESGTTVTELLTLAVKGSADEYTALARVNGGITMTYFQNDDDPEGRQMQYLKSGSDPLRLTIELDAAVTEVGDYTWIIPAESIFAVKKDGSQVVGNEMKFFWSIRNSGVAENICEDDATVTVYDMNGVCILNEAAHEELAKLPKGVYIINGKTFILK